MIGPQGTALVVDTCVVRSSGDGSARARSCRNFLQAIKDHGHCLVLTKPIDEEWRRHMSKYARKWLISMYSSRRVIRCVPQVRQDFRAGIKKQCTCPWENAAAEKDTKLIEAAREADQRIASVDARAREFFARVSIVIEEIRHIIWVNPEVQSQELVDWLKSGAHTKPELALYRR